MRQTALGAAPVGATARLLILGRKQSRWRAHGFVIRSMGHQTCRIAVAQVCAIARFLPLPLLLLLPDKVTQSEDEDRPNDEENTHAAASSNGKADPSSAAKGSPGAKGLEA